MHAHIQSRAALGQLASALLQPYLCQRYISVKSQPESARIHSSAPDASQNIDNAMVSSPTTYCLPTAYHQQPTHFKPTASGPSRRESWQWLCQFFDTSILTDVCILVGCQNSDTPVSNF